MWREDLHKRDPKGRFSTIRTGSSVVTSTGKAGVVESTTDSHYHIRFQDGKKGKVAKHHVIHAEDHKRIMEADAKAKKRKTSAAKGQTTKATNKANGHGKAQVLASEAPKMATAKKQQTTKVKTMEKKASAEKKAIRQAKKQRDLEAPDLIRRPIEQRSPKAADHNEAQNTELEKYNNLENDRDTTQDIDNMWNDKAVQKLMSRAPEKRSEADIRSLAGNITTSNDKLARYVTLQMGKSRGLNLLHQVNRIGDIGQSGKGEVVNQETGYYGDLLQAARSSMYETLYKVMKGSQNPGKDTSIGAHVVSRMKQQLHTDIYNIMNEVPAPTRIRGAIGDMQRAEKELQQKLGRNPNHEELANHLEANSKNFKESPIMDAPTYDEKTGQWVASKKRIEDPSERLHMLKTYAEQQKATSIDQNVGSEGEKEVSMADNIKDTNASPDELYEQKERQKELKSAIPKALDELGLNDKEKLVFMVMFGSPSATTHKGNMTKQEVAEAINKQGGYGEGQQATESWVNKYYRSALEKILHAQRTNHPVMEELKEKFFKSFFFNMIMKATYEYDLVKSLVGWGVGLDALATQHTRIVYGASLYSLRKSLEPYEYIGSVVTTEDGEVEARIVEFVLPEDNALYKSFNAYREELKKSMFPHKGKTHEVNKKASEYVRANAKKYSTLSEAQHASAKGKGGNHTWSEELLLKNPGSAWITWGGKRVLVNVGDGKIIYDSANDAHREEHNEGAQEDKIEFHHEKDALAEQGLENTPENLHHIDHGVQAFKEQMDDMRNDWAQKGTTGKDKGKLVGGVKKDFLDNHAHKALDAYAELPEEERAKLDKMSNEERQAYLGKHFLDKEGIKEALQKYHDNPSEGEEELREKLKSMGSVAGRNTDKMSTFLKDVQKLDPSKEENLEKLAQSLGEKEMSRAKEEANKNLLPEGKYMIGNPLTGKTMIVHIGGEVGHGGRAGAGNKYASTVVEAFDPDGGNHEEINSWGQLGKALGYTGKDAQKLKEILTQKANTDPDKPFMKQISDEDYNKNRSNTRLGLQETMAHKDFKLVNESRNKDDEVTSRTYAMDMPDGSQNTVHINAKGYITDPVMSRLLKQKKPINNVNDLHEVLKNAVGNRAWVTAHFGNDIHVGDALGHHIQLEYDGKGAPRVVGGTYDGYRFMDSNDIPKGATDPATGEPIKALFKNGKLVDRGFTTKNKVAMEAGNQVLYDNGKGGFRKGKIHSIEGEHYKVVDSKGHLVGVFKKDQLKQATEEGRALSENGNAVVRLANNGTHRMNTEDTFKADNPKDQKKVDKVRSLFEEALRKAKINDAFDKDGNLNKNLELSDAMMRNLQKRLGRSKAGKELLKKFNSAYTKELELHVPENLRSTVEQYGVKVLKNGTARISAGKFEQLREALNDESGLSLDNNAREYLEDHFKRKDRKPISERMPEITKTYQPAHVDPNSAYGKAYQAQFKPYDPSTEEGKSHFLMNPTQGLYDAQLEGIAHLTERGRGIVGHGMGIGKTIEGVVAALSYKAQKLANGEKPKKTLIIAPAGIQSDWGKEIAKHTNSKALYIGSNSMRTKDEKGNYLKSENGRHMFGQKGLEHELVSSKEFNKNMSSIGSEDHDFHIMSYDQFMKNRDALAKSGLYDNIVIDEVHAFKNQGGQRGKSLAETTDAFKNVWGLSGTPMENDAREIYSLVDTITGGRHELGSSKEFADNFLMKDKNGKIIGLKGDPSNPNSPAAKLGDILANIVQFRNGSDVQYANGDKIHFPQIVGQTSEADPNPQTDFIGDMVDRNRDHQTTEYYGTKHSVFDYNPVENKVTAKDGSEYTVPLTEPAHLNAQQKDFYDKYQKLQAEHLPESKLKEMAKASALGIDSEKGSKDKSRNYLTAMQKLQKFLNVGESVQKMYVPGGKSALDSESTGAQSDGGKKGKKKSEGFKPYNPMTGEGHYIVDESGHKRYFESDGEGGYLRNADGSPKLLPPLHHNNPKAQYLKQRISTYLDALASENSRRRKAGQPELMPKVVVKSGYTTFGTDIVDNVLHDLQNEHPHLQYWANKLQKEGKQSLAAGQFTGEAGDREHTKTAFRGNKDDYAKDQGNLWATSVSPAGKEGVDFGNAHLMLMYDQDWNPEKMAQFTARVRRSDSVKSHEQVDRSNSVRVESLHMPGTVEDFMFNAEDNKAANTRKLKESTRQAEQSPKFGDSESKAGYSKNFTRNAKHKAGAKPIGAKTNPEPMKPVKPKSNAQQAAKSLKLVILL
jgi:DNA-directed RNA polymerase specialized sigma subunit/preprotein translocase subunit YajC